MLPVGAKHGKICCYSCEKCDANGCAKKIRNTRLDAGTKPKKRQWTNHAINVRNIHVVVMLIGVASEFELKTTRMSSDWKDFLADFRVRSYMAVICQDSTPAEAIV